MGRLIFARLEIVFTAIRSVTAFLPARLFSLSWPLVRSVPGLAGESMRYVWAMRLFKSVGSNVRIGPGCTIHHWDRIECGSNVSIHERTYVDARGGIQIGDNVSIAHASSLLAFDHSWDDPNTPIKYNPLVVKDIRIEDDVWLGCGVRILSGVHLPSRTIVAAGAVMTTGEYEPGIYGGVPGRRIGETS